MELLNLEFLGQPLRLEAAMSGWQRLYWNDQLVSERAASAQSEGSIEHQFQLKTGESTISCQVHIELEWTPLNVQYSLLVNGDVIQTGTNDNEYIKHHTPAQHMPIKRPFSAVGLISLGFKLLKSAKVIKVVLAGASLAAYSWFFSFQFALALIACLVFHEYGHVRAMRYFGMKTKGIYLIPFMGGLALGDDKINTRWQDVVISIMGPTFGLIMSLVCLIAYWVTGEMFFAGLASFNALLNLFNLLPILPLDGGHILKSVAFSMNSKAGIALCGVGAAFGVYLSYTFGLALLGFLLLIGSIEILVEWRNRHHSLLLPLDRYGQTFSTVWYLLTVGSLVAIIWYFSGLGNALLGLPLKILQS